jgi:glycosyltransferase involved in cell wall biosynthesis
MVLVTYQRASERGKTNEFVEAAQQWGVPLHSIPETYPFDVRVLSHLRELTKRLAPDLIETHAVKSHAVVRASCLWRETPWIAFHHGYTNASFRTPLYNSFDRWSLRVADRVVTMNRGFERQLAQRGVPAERLVVLHNAVQLPAGHQVRPDASVVQRKKIELGISPEEKVILCVGRLSREKAHIGMVPVLQSLRTMLSGGEVRLIIVGEGPERESISRAIQSSALGNRVTFAGQCKDVTPYYLAADVVAIPSLSEGSPNVLLEAMAYGVPVVATEVGGIPEIVAHGETALLVAPHNPRTMAEAIHALLINPGTALHLAEAARKKVERDYSPEGRAKILLEIYSGVCRSGGKPRSREAVAAR